MMERFAHTIAIAGALGCTSLATGQFDFRSGQQQQRTAEQLTRMQVVTDVTHPVMRSETFQLAVVFTIESPWHLYWKNPGEGAMPPRLRIEAPDGFEIGDVRWPRPKSISSPVGDMYCYEGEFALFVPITAPDDLADGEVTFKVNADWAVCDNEMCLFGSASRMVNVPVTASDVRTLDARPKHAMIVKHQPRLAQNLGDSVQLQPVRTQQIRVRVPAHDLEKIEFFPYQSPGVTYGKPRFTRDGDHYIVQVGLQVNANNFLNGSPNVGGLVALGEKPDDPSYEFSMPLATW